MGRIFGVNRETGQKVDETIELPENASMGERIWDATKNFGKQIVSGLTGSIARTGVKAEVLGRTALGGLSQEDVSSLDRRYSKGVDVLGVHQNLLPDQAAPLRSQIAEGWLDAVNVATLAEAPTFGAALKAGAPNLIAKQGAKTFAKKTAFDAGLGASFGVLDEATQEDPSLSEGAKKAAQMALITAAFPHVFGLGVRGTAGILGKSKDVLADALEKTAVRLEDYARPPKVDPDTLSPLLRGYGDEAPITPSQRTAEQVAGYIRKAQEIPDTVRYHLDRWSGVKSQLGDEAYLTMRSGTEAGPNKAMARWTREYLPTMKENSDVWEEGKALAEAYDKIERIGLGQDVELGETADDLVARIYEARAVTPPDRWKRVEAVADFQNKFADQTLTDLVEGGLVKPEAAQRMRQLHRNYIPHDVEKYFDVDGDYRPPTSGKTANVSKSGIQKAVGSTSSLRDLDQTQLSRLVKAYTKMENSKALRDIVKMGVAANPSSFRIIRSAANVLEKEELYKILGPLMQMRDETKESITAIRNIIRKTGKEATALEREVTQLLDDAESLADELQSSPAVVRAIRQAEKRILKAYELDELKSGSERAVKELRGLEDEQKAAKVEFDAAVRDAEKNAKSVKELNSLIEEYNTGRAQNERPQDFVGGKADRQLAEAIEQKKAYEVVVRTTKTAISEAKETLRDAKGEMTDTQRELRYFVNEAEKLLKDGKANATVERLLNRAIRREERAQMLRKKQSQFEAVKDSMTEDVAQTKEAISVLRERLKELRENPVKRVDLPKGMGLVDYFNKGVREIALVPKQIETAVKYLDSETVQASEHWFAKMLQLPAKATRLLATGINPSFILKNLMRDPQEALVAGETKFLPTDYASSLITSITGKSKSVDDLTKALGEENALKLTGELAEADKFGVKTLRDLAEFSGAFRGTFFDEGKNPEKVLRELLERDVNPGWKLLRATAKPVEWIENVGQKIEEVTRLATFRRALMEGKTVKQAAFVARDATVDFQKYGPLMQTLNRYIPFLNARTQGFKNLVGAVTDRPEDTARALMYTAAVPTVGLYAYNTRYDSYRNISDQVKRNYWVIMYGEEMATGRDGKRQLMPLFFAIPKGNAQKAVGNAVELALRYGEKNAPKQTAKFLSRFAADLSPVDNASLLPAGLRQSVDLAANYDSFREREIESDFIKTAAGFEKREEVKPYQRSSAYTSEAAKAIGRVTGWSPMKVDYMMQNMGVFNDIARISDFGKTKGSAFIDATQLPVVGSVVRTSGGGEKADKRIAAEEKAQEKNEKRIISAEFRAKIREARKEGDDEKVKELMEEYAEYRKAN